MVECLDADAPRQGLVGNDQIQPVQGEQGQKIGKLALAADQTYRFGNRQRRLQQTVGDRLGHRVGDPDPKVEHGYASACLSKGCLELRAQGEYLVRVSESEAAVLREFQMATVLAEQFVSQPLLQQLDLT